MRSILVKFSCYAQWMGGWLPGLRGRLSISNEIEIAL